ncbi:MAG TPA: S-layer homology domain-containing protein, partial [Symbiobacteriaceae bacterium]|nr:S-layer homology domain-containing protein [Symbiobacteriaceae bacterium]
FMIGSRAVRADRVDPDAPLTRGEAVTLLLTRSRSVMRNVGMNGPVQLPFGDLPDRHPARGAILAAWVEGWLQPLANETLFRPDEPVTRAEFAAWAARAIGLGQLARSGLTVQPGFKDLAGLTPEQQNAATFLRSLQLLPEADTFRGAEPMTQAEGAVLTARIYNSLLKP